MEFAGPLDFEFKSQGVPNGRIGGGYLRSDVEIPDRAGETRRTALPRQGQNLHRRGPAVEGDLFLRRRDEEVIKEWIVEKIVEKWIAEGITPFRARLLGPLTHSDGRGNFDAHLVITCLQSGKGRGPREDGVRHIADELLTARRLLAELVHGKRIAVQLWKAIHAQLHTGPEECLQFDWRQLADEELFLWRNDAQEAEAAVVGCAGVFLGGFDGRRREVAPALAAWRRSDGRWTSALQGF